MLIGEKSVYILVLLKEGDKVMDDQDFILSNDLHHGVKLINLGMVLWWCNKYWRWCYDDTWCQRSVFSE